MKLGKMVEVKVSSDGGGDIDIVSFDGVRDRRG